MESTAIIPGRPIGRESTEHLIRKERRVQENMPGRPFDMESSATDGY